MICRMAVCLGLCMIIASSTQAQTSPQSRKTGQANTSELTAPTPKAAIESTRLRSLESKTQNRDAEAVDQFWKEIEKEGTPYLEQIAGNEHEVLATFLWRAKSDTRGVLLAYLPFATVWPDKYRMTRLADTDIWYVTLHLKRDIRFRYQLSPNDPPGFDEPSMAIRLAGLQADPLNRKQMRRGSALFSIAEMPDAPKSPWTSERPQIAKGKVQEFHLESSALGGNRKLVIYTPSGYAIGGDPLALLIVFDGDTYTNEIPTPVILDNLLAEKRIRPVIALFLNNVDRQKELGCNQLFSEYLAGELLPWLRTHYLLSSDPNKTVLAGSSRGGLAAACAAMEHPELFGNVLSQSAEFQWSPDSNGEPDEIVQRALQRPHVPVRFYLEVGTDELNFVGRNPIVSGRHFRDVLRAKGYSVSWHEFSGGHDFICWRESLADGLMKIMPPPD
jgi:enterochelin esterase-like enzyme